MFGVSRCGDRLKTPGMSIQSSTSTLGTCLISRWAPRCLSAKPPRPGRALPQVLRGLAVYPDACSPTHTRPAGWFLVLMQYTPPGPMARWSMSLPRSPTEMEWKTCQPRLISRSSLGPTGLLTGSADPKGTLVGLQIQSPRDESLNLEADFMSANSDSASVRTAWPGRLTAKSVRRGSRSR